MSERPVSAGLSTFGPPVAFQQCAMCVQGGCVGHTMTEAFERGWVTKVQWDRAQQRWENKVSTQKPSVSEILEQAAAKSRGESNDYNAVMPPHYRRGPVIKGDIGSRVTMGQGEYEHELQCIEVMREIQDPRLATAFKYLWRVAFGGKREPHETRPAREIDARDISSAVWYLEDWLKHPVDPQTADAQRRIIEAEARLAELQLKAKITQLENTGKTED